MSLSTDALVGLLCWVLWFQSIYGLHRHPRELPVEWIMMSLITNVSVPPEVVLSLSRLQM